MNKRYALHSGFSLVELTVVLLIITLLASVAVRETSELAFQVRYEQTRDRLNMIRQAILGNPKQIINGQQAVSGFVADMGRLPVNLRELLAQCSDGFSASQATCTGTWMPSWGVVGACVTGAITTYTIQADCPVTSTWSPLPGNLSVGWRGPYLNISGNPADDDAFTDGWGRTVEDDPVTIGIDESINYGWNYDAVTYPNGLLIQSYGKDQGPAGTDYDADFPVLTGQPVVRESDWTINIANGVDVQFQAPLFSGVCREDNVAQSACYGNAGRWENCLFLTPSQCAASGGSWGTDCRMTQTVCTTKGGTWTATGNPQCVFDATSCPLAGGSWSTTDSLCVFNVASCAVAGGAASQACLFNATTCSGTWNATEHSCSFSTAQCSGNGGLDTTSGSNASCMRIFRTPATGEQYNETSCLADGHAWYGGSRTVSACMRIFYRQNGAIGTPPSESTPIVLEENGMIRQLHFAGFTISQLPAGINAVGIYQHDGTSCTNNVYPSDRLSPIHVHFNANSTLPVINW